MKVSNYEGVKNQFLVESDEGNLLQSYNSAIVLIDRAGDVHLSDHWDYSNTTGKYRNRFLGETKKETLAKIKSGEYKLDLSLDGKIVEVN